MARFKNISTGPRGLWTTTGLVMVDAGKSVDVELAKGETAAPEWFGGQLDRDQSSEGGDSAQAPAEPATAEDILAAIDLLDPANEDHWTSAGLPAVDAVRELAGKDVTRKAIEEAAPDAKRPEPA